MDWLLECDSSKIFTQSPDNLFLLQGLDPGMMYEVMVCLQCFNLSSILPLTWDGNTRFISECGYCTTCYTTEAVFYEFDMTTVAGINVTHVKLVCDVMSNIPQFIINWSIRDHIVDASERILLDNGDVIDKQQVSIVNERQGSGSYKSTLVAPDAILRRDIQCVAVSVYILLNPVKVELLN